YSIILSYDAVPHSLYSMFFPYTTLFRSEFGWTPGIFRDCLRAGHACWVLARADEVVGYGVLSAAAGEAHVLNVCVAPHCQRRGYGQRIVKRILDDARWYGDERVFLI